MSVTYNIPAEYLETYTNVSGGFPFPRRLLSIMSIRESIVLAELIYRLRNRDENDQWLRYSIVDMKSRLNLSLHTQRRALIALRDQGLLSIKSSPVHGRCVKIEWSNLLEALNTEHSIKPSTKQKRLKKQISNEIRKQVFERDGYRCQHCGGWIDLCVDHIYPESKGGPTCIENLQTLCRPCNSKKSDKV